MLYLVLGSRGEALDYALYGLALAKSQRCLGSAHSLTATIVHNRANLAFALGDFTQAEKLNAQAVRAWSSGLGPDHPVHHGVFDPAWYRHHGGLVGRSDGRPHLSVAALLLDRDGRRIQEDIRSGGTYEHPPGMTTSGGALIFSVDNRVETWK